MTKIKKQDLHFFSEAHKRIGTPRHYGRGQYGLTRYGDDDVVIPLASGGVQVMSGIYQVRTRYGRRVQTLEAYRTGGASRTPAQQARREKFRSAVAAWQSLPNSNREDYYVRAARKKISGYNLFVREYMLAA